MSEHWCPIHKTKFFKTPNMKSYAHPIKDAAGKTTGWCNEDELEAQGVEAQAQPERQEPMINREKQSSIEAQNARTNLTNLLIADKLTEDSIKAMSPRELALVTQLYDRAGIQFGYGTFTDKGGHLVEAAKEAGAVEKPDTGYEGAVTGQFKSLGDFLNRCHTELGLERPEVEKLLSEKLTTKSDFDGMWLALSKIGK